MTQLCEKGKWYSLLLLVEAGVCPLCGKQYSLLLLVEAGVRPLYGTSYSPLLLVEGDVRSFRWHTVSFVPIG